MLILMLGSLDVETVPQTNELDEENQEQTVDYDQAENLEEPVKIDEPDLDSNSVENVEEENIAEATGDVLEHATEAIVDETQSEDTDRLQDVSEEPVEIVEHPQEQFNQDHSETAETVSEIPISQDQHQEQEEAVSTETPTVADEDNLHHQDILHQDEEQRQQHQDGHHHQEPPQYQEEEHYHHHDEDKSEDGLFPDWLLILLHDQAVVDGDKLALVGIISLTILTLHFINCFINKSSREQPLIKRLAELDRKLFSATNELLIIKKEQSERSSGTHLSTEKFSIIYIDKARSPPSPCPLKISFC